MTQRRERRDCDRSCPRMATATTLRAVDGGAAQCESSRCKTVCSFVAHPAVLEATLESAGLHTHTRYAANRHRASKLDFRRAADVRS